MAEQDALVAAIQALTVEVGRLREVLSGGNSITTTHDSPEEADTTSLAGDTLAAPADANGPCPLRAIISAAMSAALSNDDVSGFETFMDLIHTERITAPHSLQNVREFTWKSLRRNVAAYLQNDQDCNSFEVARTVPKVPADTDDTVRLFIKNSTRSPVPILLRRDEAADGAWRIVESSL